MKAGWDVKPLGDLLSVLKNGINCKQDKSGNGVKISRIESISDATFNSERVGYADLSEAEKQRYCLKKGDILFSHINSPVHVGKTAIFDCDEPIYHGVNLLLMRPTEKLLPEYLNFALKYLFQTGYWARTSKQSVNQASVNQKDISCVDISYPTSKEEQHRIVAILDEAFEAIAAARANAEQNRQNARALFESYLQSVFSQRGEGWKKVPLGGLCDFLNGYAFKSDDATSDSNTQLVRMGNLYGNKLDLDRNPVFYPDNYAADYKRFILAPGDLVMSLTGTTGKEDYGFAVQIPEADRVLLLNQRIAKFDSIKEDLVCREYLLHYLRSRVFLDLLYPTANGTRQANLSTVTMKTLPVWLCSIPEQKTIVASLDAMQIDTQRLESLYQRKIAALDELKQSLLQQAFSGQLDTTRVEVLTP